GAEFMQVPQLGYQDMRVSPDGSMIAFAIQDTSRTSREDIFVYTLATGNLKQLTRDGKSSRPVWMSDGKRIVFRMTDPAGKPVIRWFSQRWDESEPPTPIVGADDAESLEYPSLQGKFMALVRGD